jgi:antitoxin YefM
MKKNKQLEISDGLYTASQARANIFKIMDQVNLTHEPVYIKSKRNSVVVLAKEDYEGLQETLAIYSVPGLAKSIIDASNAPAEEWISHEEFWKD